MRRHRPRHRRRERHSLPLTEEASQSRCRRCPTICYCTSARSCTDGRCGPSADGPPLGYEHLSTTAAAPTAAASARCRRLPPAWRAAHGAMHPTAARPARKPTAPDTDAPVGTTRRATCCVRGVSNRHVTRERSYTRSRSRSSSCTSCHASGGGGLWTRPRGGPTQHRPGEALSERARPRGGAPSAGFHKRAFYSRLKTLATRAVRLDSGLPANSHSQGVLLPGSCPRQRAPASCTRDRGAAHQRPPSAHDTPRPHAAPPSARGDGC